MLMEPLVIYAGYPSFTLVGTSLTSTHLQTLLIGSNPLFCDEAIIR